MGDSGRPPPYRPFAFRLSAYFLAMLKIATAGDSFCP